MKRSNEHRLGLLELGKLAGYLVIDRDYLACRDDEIREIRPLRTVLGRRTVGQRSTGQL